MYSQCSSMSLRLPLSSCVDATVSCDRSLTYELPLSPSNQLMYESEPLQDHCSVAGVGRPEQPVLETGVISPSVEGLTFNDYDVLSYVFANDQLPAASAGSGDVSAGKYLSDAWKVTDSGPTLTQLNSDDLDATLLDEFSASSSGFCVDMSSLDCSQLIAVKPMITNCTSMPSTAATLTSWSEQMRQQRNKGMQQLQQQLISHLLSSQQQGDNVPQCVVSTATHTASSTTATMTSTTQLSLDCNWEAIESFLESEDERMAAEASNLQRQPLHVAANIKSEAPGISTDTSSTMNTYHKTSNKCPRHLLEQGPRNPGI